MSTAQMMNALADDAAFDYKRAYLRVSAQLEDAQRVHGAAMGRATQRAIGLETQLQQSRAETAVVRAELRTLAALACEQPGEAVRCRMAVVLKQLQLQLQLPVQLQLQRPSGDLSALDVTRVALLQPSSSPLETEPAEAKREIQRVQDVLDEYTVSSAAVEEELEQELVQSEERNAQLQKKMQSLERESEALREKLAASHAELSKCVTERDTLRAQEAHLVATTRRLEQDQDDLETRVRVLEATEANLRHELDCEREDKVFLASDHEELERDVVELKERHRIEMEDLKAELFAAQKKLLALVAAKTPLESTPSPTSFGFGFGFGEDATETDSIVFEVSMDVVKDENNMAEEAVVEEPEPEVKAEPESELERESPVEHDTATTQDASGVSNAAPRPAPAPVPAPARAPATVFSPGALSVASRIVRPKIMVPAVVVSRLRESQIEVRLASPLAPLGADLLVPVVCPSDRPTLAVVTGVAPTPSKPEAEANVQQQRELLLPKEKAKEKEKKKAKTKLKAKPTQKKQAPSRWRI